MTETALLRSEPHAEIGALIEQHAERLTEQWCRRAVAEHAAAKRVHFSTLRDHLPHFLRAMGRALSQTGQHGAQQHCTPAAEHGAERWDSGWSITEVVRDYQLLRVIVLQHLEKELQRDLGSREVLAIGVFIDDAVAASIARYVASRDGETGRIQRERVTQLQELNRRKDEFMAVLGHEMRNPLAPIQNSVAIMRALLTSAAPEVLSSLEVIERQSRMLVRLADDILDLARIGQGRLELRRRRVDLRAIIEQASQTSAQTISAREHTLAVSCPDEPLQVAADPERMTQVVANLLNNAAKYMAKGGYIWLCAERDGEDAVIRVRDSGIGMPGDMLESVFDLFTRLPDAKTYAQGGMGIGLALVRRLVEQHGGTVACRSEGAGKGSEFIVRLPLSDAQSPELDSIVLEPLRNAAN